MSALHLYGVVGTDKPLKLTGEGVAGGVRLIAEGPVAVIVGAPPARRMRELARAEALAFLLRHQQILEAALAETTVLPVRFGAVAPGEAAVRRMLSQSWDLLGAKLDEFSGSQQIEVAVTWDLDEVFAEIARESTVFHALRALGRGVGDRARAEVEAKAGAEVGVFVKTALERRRWSVAGRLFEELMTVASDVVENAPTGDAVVANFALLLDRADFVSLEGVLNRLDADFGGRLNFRCIGPFPPSSFATVDVDFSPSQAIGVTWRKGGPRILLSCEVEDEEDFATPASAPSAAGGEGASSAVVSVVRSEPTILRI